MSRLPSGVEPTGAMRSMVGEDAPQSYLTQVLTEY